MLQALFMAIVIGGVPKFLSFLGSIVNKQQWYDGWLWLRGRQVLVLTAEVVALANGSREFSRYYFQEKEHIREIDEYLQQHIVHGQSWRLDARGNLQPTGRVKIGQLTITLSDKVTSNERAITSTVRVQVEAPTKAEIDAFLSACKSNNKQIQAARHEPSFYTQTPNSEDWRKFNLDMATSWDDLFYEGKDILQRDIEQLGAKDKIVLLLHGPPGTGKTSTIRAIARATQRSIINVDLTLTKNNQELLGLFHDKFLGDYQMPLKHQRMYVFEEIDTQLEALMERERAMPQLSDDSSAAVKGDLLKYLSQQYENKLTLGGLLTVLDGVLELHNTIVIMTTNYPEKLDARLIRPGRVTHNLRLGPLRECDARAMMQRRFGKSVALRGKWLAADLEEFMRRYSDFQSFAKALQTAKAL